MRTTLPYFILAALISVSACGRKDADPAPAPDQSDAVNVPETAQPAPAPGTTTELSVDDIDRWQRGMQAELASVQEAATKLANAKDEDEKLE